LVPDLDGRTSRLDYEPGESRTGLCLAATSNWRGPVWFPLNFLSVESLRHLHNFYGDDLTVGLPTGSSKKVNLHKVAGELERRLLSLFLLDANGHHPANGDGRRLPRRSQLTGAPHPSPELSLLPYLGLRRSGTIRPVLSFWEDQRALLAPTLGLLLSAVFEPNGKLDP
jgi:hypothetical protein